jgi:alkylation response protein AidB-like acyl-CoA dehydrogenase
MYDYLLTEEQTRLRDEVRDFIKWVPRQLVLDMDKDVVKFPKEFLRRRGRRNLMGCRYPREWGAGAWTGSARGWSWRR